MYENMDQEDIAEVSTKKEKVKTVQLEIYKEMIEDLQKRFGEIFEFRGIILEPS